MATPKRGAGDLPALDAPSLDQKTEFFLTASHQLKSPVAIIQWCLQSLTENQTTLSPEARKLVNRALGQANDMSRLLQDMLQVFRVIHPKEVLKLEPLRITPIVEELIEQFRPAAEAKKIHLIKGEIENVPLVLAKEMYVREIAKNLLDNALKYTQAGRRITVALRERKGMVTLEIADEGIGIPTTEQGKIFTEFFRGAEAQEVANGTGLGLVLVQRMTESLHGRVSFQSEFRNGSTFTVSLPVAKR